MLAANDAAPRLDNFALKEWLRQAEPRIPRAVLLQKLKNNLEKLGLDKADVHRGLLQLMCRPRVVLERRPLSAIQGCQVSREDRKLSATDDRKSHRSDRINLHHYRKRDGRDKRNGSEKSTDCGSNENHCSSEYRKHDNTDGRDRIGECEKSSGSMRKEQQELASKKVHSMPELDDGPWVHLNSCVAQVDRRKQSLNERTRTVEVQRQSYAKSSAEVRKADSSVPEVGSPGNEISYKHLAKMAKEKTQRSLGNDDRISKYKLIEQDKSRDKLKRHLSTEETTLFPTEATSALTVISSSILRVPDEKVRKREGNREKRLKKSSHDRELITHSKRPANIIRITVSSKCRVSDEGLKNVVEERTQPKERIPEKDSKNISPQRGSTGSSKETSFLCQSKVEEPRKENFDDLKTNTQKEDYKKEGKYFGIKHKKIEEGKQGEIKAQKRRRRHEKYRQLFGDMTSSDDDEESKVDRYVSKKKYMSVHDSVKMVPKHGLPSEDKYKKRKISPDSTKEDIKCRVSLEPLSLPTVHQNEKISPVAILSSAQKNNRVGIESPSLDSDRIDPLVENNMKEKDMDLEKCPTPRVLPDSSTCSSDVEIQPHQNKVNNETGNTRSVIRLNRQSIERCSTPRQAPDSSMPQEKDDLDQSGSLIMDFDSPSDADPNSPACSDDIDKNVETPKIVSTTVTKPAQIPKVASKNSNNSTLIDSAAQQDLYQLLNMDMNDGCKFTLNGNVLSIQESKQSGINEGALGTSKVSTNDASIKSNLSVSSQDKLTNDMINVQIHSNLRTKAAIEQTVSKAVPSQDKSTTEPSNTSISKDSVALELKNADKDIDKTISIKQEIKVEQTEKDLEENLQNAGELNKDTTNQRTNKKNSSNVEGPSISTSNEIVTESSTVNKDLSIEHAANKETAPEQFAQSVALPRLRVLHPRELGSRWAPTPMPSISENSCSPETLNQNMSRQFTASSCDTSMRAQVFTSQMPCTVAGPQDVLSNTCTNSQQLQASFTASYNPNVQQSVSVTNKDSGLTQAISSIMNYPTMVEVINSLITSNMKTQNPTMNYSQQASTSSVSYNPNVQASSASSASGAPGAQLISQGSAHGQFVLTSHQEAPLNVKQQTPNTLPATSMRQAVPPSVQCLQTSIPTAHQSSSSSAIKPSLQQNIHNVATYHRQPQVSHNLNFNQQQSVLQHHVNNSVEQQTLDREREDALMEKILVNIIDIRQRAQKQRILKALSVQNPHNNEMFQTYQDLYTSCKTLNGYLMQLATLIGTVDNTYLLQYTLTSVNNRLKQARLIPLTMNEFIEMSHYSQVSNKPSPPPPYEKVHFGTEGASRVQCVSSMQNADTRESGISTQSDSMKKTQGVNARESPATYQVLINSPVIFTELQKIILNQQILAYREIWKTSERLYREIEKVQQQSQQRSRREQQGKLNKMQKGSVIESAKKKRQFNDLNGNVEGKRVNLVQQEMESSCQERSLLSCLEQVVNDVATGCSNTNKSVPTSVLKETQELTSKQVPKQVPQRLPSLVSKQVPESVPEPMVLPQEQHPECLREINDPSEIEVIFERKVSHDSVLVTLKPREVSEQANSLFNKASQSIEVPSILDVRSIPEDQFYKVGESGEFSEVVDNLKLDKFNRIRIPEGRGKDCPSVSVVQDNEQVNDERNGTRTEERSDQNRLQEQENADKSDGGDRKTQDQEDGDEKSQQQEDVVQDEWEQEDRNRGKQKKQDESKHNEKQQEEIVEHDKAEQGQEEDTRCQEIVEQEEPLNLVHESNERNSKNKECDKRMEENMPSEGETEEVLDAQTEQNDADDENQKLCLYCNERGKVVCGVCYKAPYCSVECQIQHWNKEHHYICVPAAGVMHTDEASQSNHNSSDTFSTSSSS
ncbi:uncharacterized protein LOC105696866 isoform X2 [Orussus abietinus]|uniref:uncharacterized protein LOC105696866 isoform X2 n=1 Tax=Orussus abietinus TaxID=222816 RepID=UPI0006258FC5|nr:uncharacterized protein LOC105696866 isoform X2 [Orussus abietinus]